MCDERYLWGVAGFGLALLMLVHPTAAMLLIVAVACAAALYYGAVVGGLYKEPLLALFRRYGDEPKVRPICGLLNAVAALSLALSVVGPAAAAPRSFLATMFPSSVFVLLAILSIGASIIIYQRPELSMALPRWYAALMANASRQERRHIGWAWLRIPLRMRWRLNGDQKAFEVWADMVRLTVIYGAYDPDSPWHKWT